MKTLIAAAAVLALGAAPAAALADQPPRGFTGPQKPGGWGAKTGAHNGGQTPGAKQHTGYKRAGGPGYGNYPSKKHPSHSGYKSPSGKR